MYKQPPYLGLFARFPHYFIYIIFVGLYVCGTYLYERYMSARKHGYSTLFSASIMSIFASARLESSATSQAKKRVKAQANT